VALYFHPPNCFLFREIVTNCPGSLAAFIECIVENDLATINSKTQQTNSGLLQILFTHNSSDVLRLISGCLMKRLESGEQLRNVRAFVREFYRSLRDMSFGQFCQSIFEAMKSYVTSPTYIQGNIFRACVEVTTMLPILGVSTTIRDAAQVRRNGCTLSVTQQEALTRFQNQLQQFELTSVRAIKWAIENLKLEPSMFVQCLYLVLFLRNVSCVC
jgi:hypothetical protein